MFDYPNTTVFNCIAFILGAKHFCIVLVILKSGEIHSQHRTEKGFKNGWGTIRGPQRCPNRRQNSPQRYQGGYTHEPERVWGGI